MAQRIWLDGQLVPWEAATVHVTTHTLHYGSGVFEGIRVYDTPRGAAIFKLREHIERLLHSWSLFRVPLPWSIDDLMEAVIETVQVNGVQKGYIRPLVWFGSGSLALNPSKQSVHVAIIVTELPNSWIRQGLRLMISSWRRIDSRTLSAERKVVGHYVNSILAQQEAQANGFDDALLLDTKGAVAECSIGNIFFVVDGNLVTPALGTILPGVTRKTIIDHAAEWDISVVERMIMPEEIECATEAFMTGTVAEIQPISQIGDHAFDSTHVTARLQNHWRALIDKPSFAQEHMWTRITGQEDI